MTAPSTNVRVVARIRPMSDTEISKGSKETLTSLNSESNRSDKNEPELVQVHESSTKKRWFELDAVFDKNSSQEEVYIRSGAKKSVCEDIFKGFNCTILAYGQTGAGKTYSMGTAAKGSDVKESDGMIPRACHDLFQTIQEKCDGNAKVELSYLEIYNEELRDLLVTSSNQQQLKIRETLDGEVYVSGLESRVVNSPEDIGKLMEEASKRRVTAATAMNAVSSRSHAMCVLNVKGITEAADGSMDKFSSKLTLVDLAGSERIKKTGATGGRAKEGININKSLLVLGQVVAALAEKNKKRSRKPPYRDSKLTRLLQDSLGGNSQTIMVACASPADFNTDESINTLRYATNARNIKNTATRNLVVNISPEEAAKLKRENQLLKQQVAELQEALNMVTIDVDNISFTERDEKNDDDTSVTSLVTGSVTSMHIEDQTKRIKELEKETEMLKKEIKNAKIDIRKSFAGSAVELPALRAEVAALREELEEKEALEEENQQLRAELDEVKTDAESAQKAASKLSGILEDLHHEQPHDGDGIPYNGEEEKSSFSGPSVGREEAWLSFLCQILDHNKNHMKKLSQDFAFGVVRVVEDMSLMEMAEEEAAKSWWKPSERVWTPSSTPPAAGRHHSSRGVNSWGIGAGIAGGASAKNSHDDENGDEMMDDATGRGSSRGSSRGVGASTRGKPIASGHGAAKILGDKFQDLLLGVSSRGPAGIIGGSSSGVRRGAHSRHRQNTQIQQRMLREQVKFFHDRMREIEGTFGDESASLKSIRLSLRNDKGEGEAENGIKDFLKKFLDKGSDSNTPSRSPSTNSMTGMTAASTAEQVVNSPPHATKNPAIRSS